MPLVLVVALRTVVLVLAETRVAHAAGSRRSDLTHPLVSGAPATGANGCFRDTGVSMKMNLVVIPPVEDTVTAARTHGQCGAAASSGRSRSSVAVGSSMESTKLLCTTMTPSGPRVAVGSVVSGKAGLTMELAIPVPPF